ncbi:MAG: ABC transporter ATP-binding protein [Desulfobacterales bacterium]|nr:ABC transporter ATP-binding protein [Desulfobacterales bacterium]
MIELVKLSKHYGKTRAVDGLDLSVSDGELFGFIGPNGAGKTTTIQMIGGLLSPTSGKVLIDGVDISKDPVAVKRKIGLIPDRPFLYEKLTGTEFLRFTADLFDVDKKEFNKKSDELLNLFGLRDRASELIEAYSHGMKQRLVMSAALLHDPGILIVDEPMVGLDPRGIKMVRNLFRRLADTGVTIFMSTHTLSLAEEICDRIGIINNGKLIATGTIDELKSSARLGQANLEQAFLELTQEQAMQ